MNQIQLQEQGFIHLEDVFTPEEVAAIIDRIGKADPANPHFRKTQELFAIRHFLKEIPGITDLIFTDAFKAVLHAYAGADYFVVKSIYFDKPEGSNWFVAWHQDLTISVDQRQELPGFGSWTVKQEQFAVQPPVELLETIFTFRIHLDDTDEENGALKVIPGSHLAGVVRADKRPVGQEEVCKVKRGGVMIMRPLLFHASGRVANNRQRRVIHIEVSNGELPVGLRWAERMDVGAGQ